MGPRSLFSGICLLIATFTIKYAVEVNVRQYHNQLGKPVASNIERSQPEAPSKFQPVQNPDGIPHTEALDDVDDWDGLPEDKPGEEFVRVDETNNKIDLVETTEKVKTEVVPEKPAATQPPPPQSPQTVPPVVEPRVILITNGTEGFNDIKEGNLEFTNCPQLTPGMKCEWLLSKGDSYLTKGDAVIFRPFNMHLDDYMPTHHPQHQKWIFHETESPFRTWNPYRKTMDFWNSFNVSILYTENADLVHSRFAFHCEKDPEYRPQPEVNYAQNKTGGILWMVSNCALTSGREDYVKEMQKYLDVDIYGRCGKSLVCGEFGELRYDCVRDYISTYKFYLAYENSFCDNYYTEKLTKMIGVNTIPVVMGLVDFNTLLTPGTFIDVRDFSSPKALSDHLNYLSSNDTAFNEIIERKRAAKCAESFPNRYHCRLCHYLHEHKDQVQTIPDGRVLWGTNENCQSREVFFKGIADEIIEH